MKSIWILICAILVGSAFGAPANDEYECGSNPADIVFVLDESGSIWGPDFTRQIQFVHDVVDMFSVTKEAVHVGAMTFSDDPRIMFGLTAYTDTYSVQAAINGTVQRRGGTKTHSALEVLRTTMFSGLNARDSIPHVCVFITDGESENKTQTKMQAELAKEQGIVIFAIGVGLNNDKDTSANENELNVIGSKPSSEFVYRTPNYTALDSIRKQIGQKVCQVTTTPRPSTTTTTTTTTAIPTTTFEQMIPGCQNRYPVDFSFALPDQAGIEDTDFALEFTGKIVDELNLGPRTVQVAVTPRYCDSSAGEITFLQHESSQAFRLDLYRRRLSSTRISQQLMHIATQLGRADARKFAVLVVDNKCENFEEAKEMAEAVKLDHTLVVIGIGPNADKQEIAQLASPGMSFYVRDYSRLTSAQNIEKVMDFLCEAMGE